MTCSAFNMWNFIESTFLCRPDEYLEEDVASDEDYSGDEPVIASKKQLQSDSEVSMQKPYPICRSLGPPKYKQGVDKIRWTPDLSAVVLCCLATET